MPVATAVQRTAKAPRETAAPLRLTTLASTRRRVYPAILKPDRQFGRVGYRSMNFPFASSARPSSSGFASFSSSSPGFFDAGSIVICSVCTRTCR